MLGQLMTAWHGDNTNIQKWLALEKAFNQLREKAMDFMWCKMSIPLPFPVQSKFDFEFVLIMTMLNGFCALMIHLTEPDRQYKGGMEHEMIHLYNLVGSVASTTGGVMVGKLHSYFY